MTSSGQLLGDTLERTYEYRGVDRHGFVRP